MRLLIAFALTIITFSCSYPQDKQVGGPCEGCEAVLEFGQKSLSPVDTLADYQEAGTNLKIFGTVYQADCKTPAINVILYAYHTNAQGIYPKKGNETGWGKRHGYLRGWIRTDDTGRYAFYTKRPASYPNSESPQHVHMTVKEKGYKPYYLSSILFTDDPLLTEKEIKSYKNRGGSGIVTPKVKNGMWMVRRDIILGKNIPNY